MRIVAVAVCVAFLMPSGAVAGPILESAERIAAGMLLPHLVVALDALAPPDGVVADVA